MNQWLLPRTLLLLCPLGGAAGSASGQTVTGLTPRQVPLGLTNAAGKGSGVSNIGEVIADLVGLEVSTAPIGFDGWRLHLHL